MKVDLRAAGSALVRRWPRHLFGGVRTSTVVLLAVFIALFWVQQAYAPKPAEQPAPQVVPPGFVPNPEYTWVPRTNVRTTSPTTPPTSTPETTSSEETTTPEETTSPSETTSPTSPTSPTPSPMPGPQTTVIDPDGPGILPPITLPVLPGADPGPPVDQPQPGVEPVSPTLPR